MILFSLSGSRRSTLLLDHGPQQVQRPVYFGDLLAHGVPVVQKLALSELELPGSPGLTRMRGLARPSRFLLPTSSKSSARLPASLVSTMKTISGSLLPASAFSRMVIRGTSVIRLFDCTRKRSEVNQRLISDISSSKNTSVLLNFIDRILLWQLYEQPIIMISISNAEN